MTAFILTRGLRLLLQVVIILRHRLQDRTDRVLLPDHTDRHRRRIITVRITGSDFKIAKICFLRFGAFYKTPRAGYKGVSVGAKSFCG